MTQGKQQVVFAGKAAEELLRLRFDTPAHLLSEMTSVSAREAFMMAGITTINEIRLYQAELAAHHLDTKKNKRPASFFASDRFNTWLMKFKRSVNARGLDDAKTLTQVGLEVSAEPEELGESFDAV